MILHHPTGPESLRESNARKGLYHYKLWLPPGYLSEPDKPWPCMFIASPGGNAKMGNTGEWLKSNGFIVAMLVESKNGPWGPILGNFLAAHDDLIRRARVREGLKFTTGMSGGGRASADFVQLRPGFGGVVMQGAGSGYDDKGQYMVDGIRGAPWLAVAMTMGRKDMNYKEIQQMKDVLGADRMLVVEFDGGHVPAPAPIFTEAMDWVMRQVLHDGPPNPALRPVYAETFRQRVIDAQSETSAWPRYRRILDAMAYAGSHGLKTDAETAAVLGKMSAAIARMRTDPAVGRELAAADALVRLNQNRSRVPPAVFAEQCRAFARQHAGTEAAEQAQSLPDNPAK